MALRLDEMKKAYEEDQEKRREGSKSYYNLEDKKNIVRILPRSLAFFSTEGDNDFAWKYYVHYKMFAVQGFKMVVCRKSISANEPCPVCDMLEALKGKPEASRMHRRERFLYNVYDPTDGLIKIMETGPKVYDLLRVFMLSDDWGDLLSLKNGRMVTIERTPEDKTTSGWAEYSVIPSPKVTDVSDVLPETWDAQIDALKTKIPVCLDLVAVQKLVDMYKRGETPVKEEKESRRDVSEERKVAIEGSAPASVQQAPVETATVTAVKLECFGKKYAPREEKCKICKDTSACRVEFFKSI